MTEMSKPVEMDEPGAHLWGSYPAPTIQQGLEEIGTTVGRHLVFGMPDGEIDTPKLERKDWVIGNLKRLRDETRGIKVVKWGDYKNYDDMAVLDIGPEGLDPYDIHLDYHKAAMDSFPFVIDSLEENHLAHLPMQVGIPGYRQYPTFAFGKYPIPGIDAYKGLRGKYLKPFIKATDDEMVMLSRDPELNAHGQGIITEHPVETIATVDTWRKRGSFVGKRLGSYMVKGMGEQIEALPRTALTGRHLCLGRFKGDPAIPFDPEEPNALEPMVYLANEDLSRWPKGHMPPRVYGIPVIPESGKLPNKKAQKEIAAQLGDIALPIGTRLVPGLITYDAPTEELVAFYRLIQKEVKGTVTPGAPCGLSSLRLHKDPDARLTVLRRHAEVAEQLRAA